MAQVGRGVQRGGTETQLELFASDAPVVPSGERVVQVVLDRVRWERPRDFGEVFLARHVWRLLGLDVRIPAVVSSGSGDVSTGYEAVGAKRR